MDIMQGYNVIIVYSTDMDKILMCKRAKNPYKGLNNLVGGKIEVGENGLEGAYRELLEETGISKGDIILNHLMDFTYYYSNCYLEVYVGRLKYEVVVFGEENELYWSDVKQNYFDMSLYAGEGNIGHMIEQVNLHKDTVLCD